jgi:hypothetical protein
MSTVEGWTTLAETPLVLLHEYSFGPGYANALAVRLPDGQFLLVSAPKLRSPETLRALAVHGKVAALLAINGAHHLGLSDCRSVFPEAKSYATPDARKRILKKGDSPGALAPLSELEPLLGDAIAVVAAEGCKVGDVLVRVETERGTVLYCGDFIANIPTLPKNPLAKLMFKLFDSGPGLKVFRIFFTFFVANKQLLRDFLIREIEARPPAILVPGHGEVVIEAGLAPKLVGMLRRAV